MYRSLLLLIPTMSSSLFSVPGNLLAQPSWPTLASEDPLFAQMVAVLAPDYEFLYSFVRDRPIGDLYLLSGIPVVLLSGPPPAGPEYFDQERPAAGLVTSFWYGQEEEAVPVERALMYARRTSTDRLTFRCELFSTTGVRRAVCSGDFNVQSGDITFDFLDFLFDKTEDRIRGLPDAACVNDLYPIERARGECEFLDIVNNLRCSVASYLDTRHQCRSV